MLTMLLASTLITMSCRATDGDTIRCGPSRAGQRSGRTAERIRLLGIDAPEKRCPPRRRCAPGDWRASQASLSAALRSGSPVIRRVGTDRYGRTLANVSVNGVDLSCHQLLGGQAIYRREWDNGGRVIARCPRAPRTNLTTHVPKSR